MKASQTVEQSNPAEAATSLADERYFEVARPEGPGCAAEIEAFLRGLGERIEVSSFEVREFVACGAEVMSFGSFAGTARGTRRAVAADWAMQWRVQDGRLRMTKAYVPSFGAPVPAPRAVA